MKTAKESEYIPESTPVLQIGSGIFVSRNIEPFVVFLNKDYEMYLKNKGKLDIFSYLKQKIRMMRLKESDQIVSQYGLAGLMIYEQELSRAYERIASNKEMSSENKKQAIFWLLLRLATREILWMDIL